jgi:signal transduction histidine kinase
MARLVAEGTAAEWAQVWLLVNDRPTLVAGFPPTASADMSIPPSLTAPGLPGGLRSVTVGHNGELLGFLRLKERPEHPLTSVEERLFAGVAAQAGLALHAAKMRAELRCRHADLASRAEELRAARTRLVTAQDEARRHLERDIHDGAQQQLVALGINLRLAQTLADRNPGRARELLGEQAAAAEEALETLVTLARGDHPRVLREEGLLAALRAVAAASPLPVILRADEVGRLPTSAEAALYFSALEALQNAVKHADASSVQMSLALDGGLARLRVADDGRGINETDVPGAGRANIRDRLAPLGGAVLMVRRPEGGTEVTVSVPIPIGVAP